jgi:hypothetical protein
MYHYLYKVTNNINGRYYFGAHSTNKLDDGYLGSGVQIKRAIVKYGSENFKKEILCYCSSESELYELEELVVDQSLVENKMCYNSTVGGKGGFYHINNNRAAIEKSAKSRKGLVANNKGVSPSSETIEKLRAAKLGKKRGKYKSHKAHTEESNKRKSEIMKQWWSDRKMGAI